MHQYCCWNKAFVSVVIKTKQDWLTQNFDDWAENLCFASGKICQKS
jgi:hypothetical protein